MRCKHSTLMFGIFVLILIMGSRAVSAFAHERHTHDRSGVSDPKPGLVESAFVAGFDSEPPGLASNGFELSLGGVQFDFVFTHEGDGYGIKGFSHATAFGEADSASMNLQSGVFNVGTTERVVIARNDGADFIFESLYVNNRGGTAVTVTALDNEVEVATAQNVAAGAAAALNFSGLVVDEVRLSSAHFEDTNIDSFAGNSTAEKDYGDLPSSYAITTDVNGGARHAIGSHYLGSCVDADADGQPSSAADGDGLDGSGNTIGSCEVAFVDEDGVEPGPGWHEGANGGTIDVSVIGGQGCLSGWIDWYGDDEFSDAEDHVLNMEVVNSGANVFTFDVPAGAISGSSQPTFYARFRLTGDSGAAGDCSDDIALAIDGPAASGEVEDYRWSVAPTSVGVQAFSKANDSPVVLLTVVMSLAVITIGTFFLGSRRGRSSSNLQNRCTM